MRKSVLLIFSMLCACQQDIEIIQDDFMPIMVAYAEIQDDSILSVNLSASVAPSSNDNIKIPALNNATIELINKNNQVVCVPELMENGYYVGGLQPNEDSPYALNITSEYGPMMSEEVALVTGLEDKMELKIEEFSQGFFDYTNKLLIDLSSSIFSDEPKIISITLEGYDRGKDEFFSILPNITDDFAFSFLCDFGSGTNDDITFLLSNECLNMEETTQIEIAFSSELVLLDQDNLMADELIVSLSVYSSSYYNFISEFIFYDGIDLFFAIPNKPYSSFDNGFGYFASKRSTTRWINIK